MDKDEYYRDLKRRQDNHQKQITQRHDSTWRPCMHDECPSCVGTGIKTDGTACIHGISCPCPKCSPSFSSGDIQWTHTA